MLIYAKTLSGDLFQIDLGKIGEVENATCIYKIKRDLQLLRPDDFPIDQTVVRKKNKNKRVKEGEIFFVIVNEKPLFKLVSCWYTKFVIFVKIFEFDIDLKKVIDREDDVFKENNRATLRVEIDDSRFMLSIRWMNEKIWVSSEKDLRSILEREYNLSIQFHFKEAFVDQILHFIEEKKRDIHKRPHAYNEIFYKKELGSLGHLCDFRTYKFLCEIPPKQVENVFYHEYTEDEDSDGPRHIETYVAILTKKVTADKKGKEKRVYSLLFYSSFNYSIPKIDYKIVFPELFSDEKKKKPLRKNMIKRLNRFDTDEKWDELMYQVLQYALTCQNEDFSYCFLKYKEEKEKKQEEKN